MPGKTSHSIQKTSVMAGTSRNKKNGGNEYSICTPTAGTCFRTLDSMLHHSSSSVSSPSPMMIMIIIVIIIMFLVIAILSNAGATLAETSALPASTLKPISGASVLARANQNIR